ncbi:MAG TPA: DMT family transporter [Xanthobacteraceae bacterium]|nr:DMT family transporter [Xanthobacteraceae bacterium]
MAFRFVFASAPGIAAAAVLGASDVLVKIVAASHCDVLTMLSFRSVIGLAFMAVWLRLGGAAVPANARVRWISIGLGVLLTVLLYCLFEAIDLNDVSTAVLTYFVYPLLTGLAAAVTGLERLRWQGIACALLAFGGLAIMIGAHPAGLVLAGIAFALAAAVCRTGVLIVTRAFLVGADARLTTSYSVIAQAAIFVALSAITQRWQPPQTDAGWAALVGMSLATTAGIVFIFVSTMRVGPFRTALIIRAHDRDGGKCRGARRHDHAAARTRQRHNACGSGGVPIAEMSRRRTVTTRICGPGRHSPRQSNVSRQRRNVMPGSRLTSQTRPT